MAEQACGFRGCTNATPGDYPWQICDPCHEMSSAWDDDWDWGDDPSSPLKVVKMVPAPPDDSGW